MTHNSHKPAYYDKVQDMWKYARSGNTEKLIQEFLLLDVNRTLHQENLMKLYGNVNITQIKQSHNLNKRLNNIDPIELHDLDDLEKTISELDQIEIESRKNIDYQYIKRKKDRIIRKIGKITDFLLEDTIDTLHLYAEMKDLPEYLSSKIDIEQQIENVYEFNFNFTRLYKEIKKIEKDLIKNITEQEINTKLREIINVAEIYIEQEKLEYGLDLLETTDEFLNKTKWKNNPQYEKLKKKILTKQATTHLKQSFEYAEKADIPNMEYELEQTKKIMTQTNNIDNITLYSIKNTGYKEKIRKILTQITEKLEPEELQKLHEEYIYTRNKLSRTALEQKDLEYIREKDKTITYKFQKLTTL